MASFPNLFQSLTRNFPKEISGWVEIFPNNINNFRQLRQLSRFQRSLKMRFEMELYDHENYENYLNFAKDTSNR